MTKRSSGHLGSKLLDLDQLARLMRMAKDAELEYVRVGEVEIKFKGSGGGEGGAGAIGFEACGSSDDEGDE